MVPVDAAHRRQKGGARRWERDLLKAPPARARTASVPYMGFRARKSFKLAPGIRMTVTPRGVGVSTGVKGARVSVHSSGRVTKTVGIPGTGISHTQTTSSGNRAAESTPVARPAGTAQPAKPGMLAPRWHKDLFAALMGSDFTKLEAIAQSDSRARQTCMFVDAIMNAYASGDAERARSIAETLWREGYDPTVDPFLSKYFPAAAMQLGVVDGITVVVPCDRDTLGLALAELRQMQGDVAGAVDLVEQLTPSTLAAVSLAELYAQQHRWADIVDLTNGLSNDDDFATFLLIQRGVAFREQQHYEAAREAFKVAYAARTREPVLRRLALVERGQTYLAEGKTALARKDFEKVLAEDSHYPGLSEHLASLNG